MRKDRACHMFHVIRNDIIAPGDSSMCLAGTIEGQCSARADPQLNGAMDASSTHQFHNVILDARLNAYLTCRLLQPLELLRTHNG